MAEQTCEEREAALRRGELRPRRPIVQQVTKRPAVVGGRCEECADPIEPPFVVYVIRHGCPGDWEGETILCPSCWVGFLSWLREEPHRQASAEAPVSGWRPLIEVAAALVQQAEEARIFAQLAGEGQRDGD